jgi:SAM-dependent methyltransferase
VLEVGAGRAGRRGRFAPPPAEAAGWVTLDLAAHRRPDVRADLLALPFPGARFDTALCLEVLEYVPEPAAALRELARVLAPGGTLILSAPFLHRVDAERDLWRFTDHGLRHLLEAGGFEVSRLEPQAHALGVVVNVAKYALYAAPRGLPRELLGRALRPLLSALWAADRPLARRHPRLASFSTGYLAVGRRRGDALGAPPGSAP